MKSLNPSVKSERNGAARPVLACPRCFSPSACGLLQRSFFLAGGEHVEDEGAPQDDGLLASTAIVTACNPRPAS